MKEIIRIRSLKTLLDFVTTIAANAGENIYFDVETTGFFDFKSRLLLAQFYFLDKVYIINFLLDGANAEKYFEYIIKSIKMHNLKVIGQNLKFDYKFTYWYTGIKLYNVYDTMIAEAIITGGEKRYSSLETLAKKYSGITLNKTVRSNFENAVTITEEMINYGVKDVLVLEDIYNKQLAEIKALKLEKILDLEMKLLPVIVSMEYTGVTIDTKKWTEVLDELEKKKSDVTYKIKNLVSEKILEYQDKFSDVVELAKFLNIPLKLKREINHYTGDRDFRKFIFDRFNITSPLQVKTVINELSTVNIDSTSSKTLKSIQTDDEFANEFIELLLEYRTYNIRINAFGEKFLNLINPITGKIHASFNQVGTRTGRFSSSNPNLQQIPAEDEYRSAFIAREGYRIITADYSQQELRLAGWVSGEEKIIDAYKNDVDIHATTASLVFDKPVNEISSKERKVGKMLNFAILYGSTEYGIAYNMGVDINTARQYLHKFFDGYNNLSTFKKLIEREVVKLMYSSTPMGRKRFFEHKVLFNDNYEREKHFASIKREGFNHIIQGGSADMLKLALVEMYYNNPFDEGMFNILMVVHDEVVVEAHESIIEEAKNYVVDTMNRVESYFIGEIPPKTGCIIADYWSKD